MSLVIDESSESGFVFGSVIEFMKCWETGANSRLVFETFNGNAWVNLSCCLGRPHASHVVPARKKSRKREMKDNQRAAAYQQKLRPDEPSVEAFDKSNEESYEEVTKEETSVEGFVDCSLNVKSTDYNCVVPNMKDVNETLKVATSKYLNEKFPDVEIVKMSFDYSVQNAKVDNKSKTRIMDHKVKILFKQKGFEEDLLERDFSDEIKSLMESEETIPIPLENRYLKLDGGKNIKLENVKLVST